MTGDRTAQLKPEAPVARDGARGGGQNIPAYPNIHIRLCVSDCYTRGDYTHHAIAMQLRKNKTNNLCLADDGGGGSAATATASATATATATAAASCGAASTAVSGELVELMDTDLATTTALFRSKVSPIPLGINPNEYISGQ